MDKAQELRRLAGIMSAVRGIPIDEAIVAALRDRPDLLGARDAAARVHGELHLIEGGRAMPSNESTYPPWRRLFIVGVNDEKARCAALLPHFLKGMGHPVAIPAGSASDFALPPEARDTSWWGGLSGDQWFPDECLRYGLINSRIDAPVERRGGAPARAHGTPPAPVGGAAEIERLVEIELKSNTGLNGNKAEARRLVLARHPALYEVYRRESTRTKGGSK